jgi:osmoprotectant transport system ATP-binding protein
LRSVTHTFGRVVAARDLTLEIPRGQTTVLLGPSGGGKSTALRLMLGLLIPQQGEVRFQGECITPHNARGLRRRMGYVIQGGGLFPHLTVRDNATLLAKVLHWPRAQVEQRLQTLCELARLPPGALDVLPRELSGGQAQRVALMRALMLDPDVLLLDEPLGALDPDTRYDLQADLKRVFNEVRKTVVLVTHDLPEAYYFGHSWRVIQDGHCVQQGIPTELMAQPADAFVARFLRAQRPFPVASEAG